MAKFNKLKLIGVILFIGLFYVLFPTNNSSLDAYAYGEFVKFNQNIFTHHHLLQNYLVFNLNKFLLIIGIKVDVLLFGKFINGIFVMLNLGVLSILLNFLKVKKKEILLLLFFVGFSFNFWRYGTENEVYIIPIFFSLIASVFFIKYIKKESTSIRILIISLFAAVACLFHQVHFFWWFGLFLGLLFFDKRNIVKVLFFYVLGGLIVPLVYGLVIFNIEGELNIDNFIHFIFHAFYKGSVQSGYDLMGLFLTFVGFFRSVFQVHPSILFLIKKNMIFIIPILILIASVIFIIFKFNRKEAVYKRKNISLKFIKTHFLILVFYLLFSHYCYGNIEFIVMLPIIIVLTFMYKFKINLKLLTILCFVLFVWNFSYGIYPNNAYSFFGQKKIVNFIIKNPNDYFIVKDLTILNAHYYEVGIPNYKKIIIVDHKTKEKALLNLLKDKEYFYTNIFIEPKIFNRSALTVKVDSSLFTNLKREKVLGYEGLYGKTEVHKVYLK